MCELRRPPSSRGKTPALRPPRRFCGWLSKHRCDGDGSVVVQCLERRLFLSAATFEVTQTANGGAGSLRHAIYEANASGGSSVINFDIGAAGQVENISLTSPLPVITESVTIDGTTEPGFAGSPLIQLSGPEAGLNTIGLEIAAASVTVKSLVVGGFGTGIQLDPGADGDVIQGCYIGANAAGTAAAGGQQTGILLDSSSDTIGGAVAGDGDVISGNARYGVFIESGSGSDVIEGDDIGTDPTGALAVPNGTCGIYDAGSNVSIGADGSGNVISGNLGDGIVVAGPGTQIVTNMIGTNAAGTAALPNSGNGIRSAPINNTDVLGATIGGAGSLGNVISGNGLNGIKLTLQNADPNQQPSLASFTIEGDVIGANAQGTAAIANGRDGINLGNFADNFGGDVVIGAPGAGNLISGNSLEGIIVRAGEYYSLEEQTQMGFEEGPGSGVTIQSNKIGANESGSAAIANGMSGIYLRNFALIGGSDSSTQGNLISGNTFNGITVESLYGRYPDSGYNIVNGNAGQQQTSIEGNIIGADASGTQAIPNGNNGIRVDTGLIFNPSNEPVFQTPFYTGCELVAESNVIAFNGNDGVYLPGDAVATLTENSIFGNANLGIDDSGENYLVPSVTQVSTSVSGTSVTGSATVLYFPGGSCLLEFFESSPGGSAQGETYLGNTSVSEGDNATSGLEVEDFTFSTSTELTVGDVVTVTATQVYTQIGIAEPPSYNGPTSPFTPGAAASS